MIKKFFIQEALAHCDIPCGIYTGEPAITAAETVIKMAEKIGAANPSDAHSIARFTAAKEEHAQLCKEQLLILWTDYFKPEHLEKFPDLHTKIWEAAKLCSKNKQEVSVQAANELLGAVNDIARIFEQSKK
jgi:nickel superoxide dismutase